MLDILQIYLPLAFSIIVFFVPSQKFSVRKVSIIFAFTLLLCNLLAILLSNNSSLNEVWSYIVVMNQEKSFDFFIYRTIWSNIIIVLMSVVFLFSLFLSLNQEIKNERFFHSLYFLLFWFLILFFYSDSFVLFISSLELIGVVILFIALSSGLVGKESIKKASMLWAVSSLFMFLGFVIIATTLGSAKGIYDVTISSLPSMLNNIQYFPNKALSIAFMLSSIAIKIGLFPFHGWIIRLLDSKNTIIRICLLFYWPQVIIILVSKLFAEMDIPLGLFNLICITFCLSSAFIFLISFREKHVIGYLSLLCNSVGVFYILISSYEEINYAHYIFLGLGLFLTILSILEANKISKAIKLSDKIIMYCRKYITCSSFFFPVSMFFISAYLMLVKFSEKESLSGYFLLILTFSMLVLYMSKQRKVSNRKSEISYSTAVPLVLLTLAFLIFGLIPSILLGEQW